MTHGVQGMCIDSARFWCALRALSAPKSRSFAVEVRAILREKNLKVSAIAATDARTLHQNDVDDRLLHAAQDAQLFLGSSLLFAAQSAAETCDFR